MLTAEQVNILTERRIELLAELRPNAVALVDSFDYPDRMLNSCLGRNDGQVYDALYEYAKSSTLNQHQVFIYLRPSNIHVDKELTYTRCCRCKIDRRLELRTSRLLFPSQFEP